MSTALPYPHGNGSGSLIYSSPPSSSEIVSEKTSLTSEHWTTSTAREDRKTPSSAKLWKRSGQRNLNKCVEIALKTTKSERLRRNFCELYEKIKSGLKLSGCLAYLEQCFDMLPLCPQLLPRRRAMPPQLPDAL